MTDALTLAMKQGWHDGRCENPECNKDLTPPDVPVVHLSSDDTFYCSRECGARDMELLRKNREES